VEPSQQKEIDELRWILEEVLQILSMLANDLDPIKSNMIYKRIKGFRERLKWVAYGNVQ